MLLLRICQFSAMTIVSLVIGSASVENSFENVINASAIRFVK